MKEEILLSIVTCGKNDDFAGNFVQRLEHNINKIIDGINKLGLSDIEVIVTDWGSDPENKLSVVANIEKSDYVKFLYVSPELCKKYSPDSNFSVPHSINCGMRRSTGRYVMYIDGDSYIPNNSLEKLYNLLKTHSQNEDDNVYYWASRYMIPYKFQSSAENIEDMDNLLKTWIDSGKPVSGLNDISNSFYHSKVDLSNFMGGAMGLLISRKILEETGFLYESLTKWGWMDVEFAQRVSARYNCMGDLLELLDCEFYHIGHHEVKVGHDVHGFNPNLRPENFLQNIEWGLNGEDLIFDYIKNTEASFSEGRRYLPTLSELIDRLSIAQLKEVFIPEHKEEYAMEINDIVHDIELILDEKDGKVDAETIRAIVVLSQMNLHIWHNESNYRKGIKDGNNLELTHGLNGIRNTAKNKIQEIIGGRKDYKIDCLAADFKDWEISWKK